MMEIFIAFSMDPALIAAITQGLIMACGAIVASMITYHGTVRAARTVAENAK